MVLGLETFFFLMKSIRNTNIIDNTRNIIIRKQTKSQGLSNFHVETISLGIDEICIL